MMLVSAVSTHRVLRAVFLVMGFMVILPVLLGGSCTPEGHFGPVCCPKVTAFTATFPWICRNDCSGRGGTSLEYEVTFWDGERLCSAPAGYTVSIRNITDNIDLGSMTLTNTGLGTYRGSHFVQPDKDTEYELVATAGGTWCGTVTGKLKVNVVDPGEFHTICIEGKLDPPVIWMEYYVPFGSGVDIDYVKNSQSLWVVSVAVNNVSTLIPGGQRSDVHHGLSANANWRIGLAYLPDAEWYNASPNPKLCIEVYLKCRCPDGSP